MRTPEQGHTRKCLAHALICAIENARDADSWADSAAERQRADTEFRIWAQGNQALVWADEYLASDTVTCQCPPTMAWVLWFGGHSYAQPYVAEDTVEMPLEDVARYCEDRYYNRDGQTPAVDETSQAWVFLSDPRDVTDPYPDKLARWDAQLEEFIVGEPAPI